MLFFRFGVNDNIEDIDTFDLDDMPDGIYDASGEVEQDDDVGMSDMIIDNQPCFANKFEGYGDGCAIPTKSSYRSTEFGLKHFKCIPDRKYSCNNSSWSYGPVCIYHQE